MAHSFNNESSTQAQIAELQRRIEQLEQLIAQGATLPASAVLQAPHNEMPADHSTQPAALEPAATPHWSRRALLLGGMGAAAAAAAHVSGASPAAAAAGDPLVLGRSNTSNRGTQLSSTDIGTAVEIVSTEGARETVAVTNRGLPANPLLPNLGSALYAYHATDGQGVSAASARGAAVRLGAGQLTTAPRSGLWKKGDLVSTRTGEVWLCTADGNGAGDWRLLGSPASSGAYVPLTPTRVYDSRKSQPDNRILVGGSNRVIDVAFARNPDTGAAISRLVPLGTRAIAANITITGTTQSGYVALTPGVATTFAGSSINWTASQTTLANGLILTTDTLVQLKAWTVGGNTHLIIDVVGYYAQA